MSESKTGVNEAAIQSITEAVIIVDLTHVKSATNITLNVNSEIVKHSRENSSKGMNEPKQSN